MSAVEIQQCVWSVLLRKHTILFRILPALRDFVMADLFYIDRKPITLREILTVVWIIGVIVNIGKMLYSFLSCRKKLACMPKAESSEILVLRCINNCELNSQWNPCICPTECMRSKVVLLNEASDTFLQLIYGCVALPF